MRSLVLLILMALALPLPGVAQGRAFRWGVEAGGNWSALELRSRDLWGEAFEQRVFPSFGIFAQRPLSARWAVSPRLRYVQQGSRSSWSTWQDQVELGGWEESREHTVGCGLGIQFGVAEALFLEVSPELTYLMAATRSETRWSVTNAYNSGTIDEEYASDSDRWNGTIRAGVGSRWSLAGGTWLMSVRYVRGINDMTRISSPRYLLPTQRNIAWTASPTPPQATEWRSEGLELVAGFQW